MSRMKPGARGARGEGGSSSRSTKTTIVEGCNNSPQHRSQVKLDIRDERSRFWSLRCRSHDELTCHGHEKSGPLATSASIPHDDSTHSHFSSYPHEKRNSNNCVPLSIFIFNAM
jgi:hypothetical protein